MRRAIFVKFIQVIVAALILNSAIFYIASGSAILKNSRKDMEYTLRMMDGLIDYRGDLEAEARRVEKTVSGNQSRFTIIDLDGSVVADTGAVDKSSLDNHLDRAEVEAAIRDGSGYSRRYSDTQEQNMLYVAVRSERGEAVLRMAVPYQGMREYLVLLLPAVWLSFLAAMLYSAFSADQFSLSVTRPLKEISQRMQKIKGDYTDFSFETCQYPEINIIAETTTKMSKRVREYLSQIELEKEIRQEFFSNASHELKTPITSIQGYAELLEQGIAQSEEQRMDFIRRMKKEAVHMTDLINDILMISRLESEQVNETEGEVRMDHVLEDVLESLKPLSAALNVTIRPKAEPVAIRAGEKQMTELLGNLISNGVKYNKPGGQVWVSITREEGQMVVKVRDNGVGIPAECLERIFERFYRVDKGRSRKQGGTGLGLAIVKHIVTYCHGTVVVISEVDVGTEFTVKIPI